MEPECCNQQLALPMEMILKIISNLKTIEDIKTCMVLSKEINNSMFKSPEIMRNIKIHFKCLYESHTAIKVLKEHGRFISCLSIIAKVSSSQFINDILSLVPNLEEFRLERFIFRSRPSYPWTNVCSSWLKHIRYDFDVDDENSIVFVPPEIKLSDFWNCNEDSLDMIKLKALKIDVRDLKHILKATRNVSKLEKLTIFTTHSYPMSYDEFMFDFICQQHNLKELNIIDQYFEFPNEEQISKVNFRLKRFKSLLTKNYENYDNFTRFLAIHADSLEELEVDHSLSPQCIQLVFEKFHKLQKFTIKSEKNSEIYSRNHPDWILPNIKHFDDQCSDGINLDSILKRFPNIESLKCDVINHSSGKFHKITNLEVKNWNPICYFREEIMRNNISSIKNIEHLSIRGSRNTQIFKYLGLFEKLKTFNFRAIPYGDDQARRIYKMSDNEEIPTNYMFYDIMADMDKKIVKVTKYIVQHEKEIYDDLVDNFKGFEFHQFR